MLKQLNVKRIFANHFRQSLSLIHFILPNKIGYVCFIQTIIPSKYKCF